MIARLLGLIRRPLRAAEAAVTRFRARQRCELAPGAVVYEPDRVQPLGGPGTISIGANTHVRGELMTFPGGRVRIGEYCYVGEQTRIWSASSIEIGDRVLIAHLVTILDNLTHPLDAGARHEHYKTILTRGHVPEIDLQPKPVRIESDAWLACGVVVLRGVTIGCGAVVGAGSVVTRDVPPHTLVAGNPAKVIRELDAGGGAAGGP